MEKFSLQVKNSYISTKKTLIFKENSNYSAQIKDFTIIPKSKISPQTPIMANYTADDEIEESYESYEEYKDEDDDDDDEDDDDELHEIVKCKYCKKKLTKRSIREHIQRKHIITCPYCDSQMTEGRLDEHLKKKHMSACKHCNELIIDREMSEHIQSHFASCEYCGNRMLRMALSAHIQQRHNFDALVGIIHGNRLTDDKFNDLVKQNRVYSLNGIIYVGD